MMSKVLGGLVAGLLLVEFFAQPAEAAKACTCELQIDKQDPILLEGNGSTSPNDWAQFKINFVTPPGCKQVDVACEPAGITYKWSLSQIISGKVVIDGPDNNPNVKLSHVRKEPADFIVAVSVSLVCKTRAETGEQEPLVYILRRAKDEGSTEFSF